MKLYSTGWQTYSPKIGETFYLWQGEETTSKTTVDAWNGEDGRLPLEQGYVGFIGIPFSAFHDGYSVADVKGLLVNIPNPQVDEVLYIDEFWATDKNSKPDVTFPEPEPTEPKVIHVMDMESASLDDIPKAEVVHGLWGGEGTDIEITKAAGKGFDGSAAIGYKILSTSEKPILIRMDNL